MNELAALVVLASAATGCTTPAYWVRCADVGAAVTPAVRASDGAEVRLRGGSYRATGEAARSDGRVVVRGAGVHGVRFKVGAAVLGVGLAMAAGGAALAVTNLDLSCFAETCNGKQPRSTKNGGAFAFGVSISILGDAMAVAMGPALMISGARQPPEEVR
jgi:hypothetical protein